MSIGDFITFTLMTADLSVSSTATPSWEDAAKMALRSAFPRPTRVVTAYQRLQPAYMPSHRSLTKIEVQRMHLGYLHHARSGNEGSAILTEKKQKGKSLTYLIKNLVSFDTDEVTQIVKMHLPKLTAPIELRAEFAANLHDRLQHLVIAVAGKEDFAGV